MNYAFLLGYDPGGEHAHGLALCEVAERMGCWCPQSLITTTASSLREVMTWVEVQAGGSRLLAVGLDTLTEWNTGPGGWRPADLWLQRTYPAVRKSVTSPNSLFGSMAVNGAAFLTILGSRIEKDRAQITEAHPKVLYHALTGRKHDWKNDRDPMATWVLQELGLDIPPSTFGPDDHTFDAALALLPALRGLNGEWTLDLHTLEDPKTGDAVRFMGRTNYWWPSAKATSEVIT